MHRLNPFFGVLLQTKLIKKKLNQELYPHEVEAECWAPEYHEKASGIRICRKGIFLKNKTFIHISAGKADFYICMFSFHFMKSRESKE